MDWRLGQVSNWDLARPCSWAQEHGGNSVAIASAAILCWKNVTAFPKFVPGFNQNNWRSRSGLGSKLGIGSRPINTVGDKLRDFLRSARVPHQKSRIWLDFVPRTRVPPTHRGRDKREWAALHCLVPGPLTGLSESGKRERSIHGWRCKWVAIERYGVVAIGSGNREFRAE